MSCDLFKAAMVDFHSCLETDEGSRLTTHCMYPSFEPVYVFVAKVGEGFKVHDGSGAFSSAWLHGRDDLLIGRTIDAECRRFSARRVGNAVAIDVESTDWLPSAILAVANASSLAAHAAVARIVATTERVLVDTIQDTLTRAFGSSRVSREVELRGRSGGKRRFDIAVDLALEDMILLNGVSPHHNSVSAKYVSFSDTNVARERKFAVHDRDLETSDVVLLQQVAQIVPLTALRQSVPILRHA